MENLKLDKNSSLVQVPRRDISESGRLDYINAVKCLQSTPARTGDIHAGAKSRYDDFQALHIDQTDYIHFCVCKRPF